MAISQINTNSIASGAVSAADLASGAITSAALPAGSVLQTVTQQDSNSETITISVSSTFLDAGLQVSITSKATNSKFLVSLMGGGWFDSGSQANMYATFDSNVNGAGFSAISGANGGTNQFGLLRMSGDSNAYNIKPYSMILLDSPAQSAGTTIIYRVVARSTTNSSAFQDNDRGIPTITVMEIAA